MDIAAPATADEMPREAACRHRSRDGDGEKVAEVASLSWKTSRAGTPDRVRHGVGGRATGLGGWAVGAR